MFLEIGGIVINLNNMLSFKVDIKDNIYYLQILMINNSGYNIAYENVEHLLIDIKRIVDATTPKK